MQDVKVRELMSPVKNYEIVKKSDYLEDVIDIFLEEIKNRDSKILVVEDDDKMIGILSVGDILRILKKLTRTYGQHEIFQSSSLINYGSDSLQKNTENDLKVGFSLKIKEIMKVNRQKISTEDLGITALEIMLENNLRVLPVYDKKEKIVGIIRDVDLLECIVDLWKEGRK